MPIQPTDAEELRALALRLAKASLVLAPDESDAAAKLCEVLKGHLAGKVRTLVAVAGDLPVVCSYVSDATPLRTKVRFVSAGGPGGRLVRDGRRLEEFLLQRSTVKYFNAHRQPVIAVLAEDAVPLRLGKKGGNLYSAATAHMPSLKELSHRGISIQHFVFDRGAYSSVGRLLHQRTLLAGSGAAGGFVRPLSDTESLREWTLSSACAAHDAQSSLR